LAKEQQEIQNGSQGPAGHHGCQTARALAILVIKSLRVGIATVSVDFFYFGAHHWKSVERLFEETGFEQMYGCLLYISHPGRHRRLRTNKSLAVRHLFHFVHRQLALQNRKEARCFGLVQGFFI